MKVTVYFPDRLWDRIKGEDEINVSQVCQQALEGELTRREAARTREHGMKRVGVEVQAETGLVTYWFVGTRLVQTVRPADEGLGRFDDEEVEVYRTRKSRYAAYWPDHLKLVDVDTIEELVHWIGPELAEEVAVAGGEPREFELDI